MAHPNGGGAGVAVCHGIQEGGLGHCAQGGVNYGGYWQVRWLLKEIKIYWLQIG